MNEPMQVEAQIINSDGSPGGRSCYTQFGWNMDHDSVRDFIDCLPAGTLFHVVVVEPEL